jgi:hypothetical protein
MTRDGTWKPVVSGNAAKPGIVRRTFRTTLGDLAAPAAEELDIVDGESVHSVAVAGELGFGGPLVIGVNIYARCIPGILEMAESWMDQGWIEMRCRGPTYRGWRCGPFWPQRGRRRPVGSRRLSLTRPDVRSV